MLALRFALALLAAGLWGWWGFHEMRKESIRARGGDEPGYRERCGYEAHEGAGGGGDSRTQAADPGRLPEWLSTMREMSSL